MRIRTYWYAVDSVDFYPYHFPEANSQPERLLRLLSEHDPYNNLLDSLDECYRLCEMEKIVEQLKDR